MKEVSLIRVSDNLMLGTPLLEVGFNNITKIEYHSPMGEGDKHFTDVYFENNGVIRFFDILSVVFGKPL